LQTRFRGFGWAAFVGHLPEVKDTEERGQRHGHRQYQAWARPDFLRWLDRPELQVRRRRRLSLLLCLLRPFQGIVD